MFDSPFVSYAYSYPHKSAYRSLSPVMHLSDVWAEEEKESLFLYLHIPFCEFRCGFCNLFTLSRPSTDLPEQYLAALARQIETVRAEVPEARFASFAIGGGTPTFMSVQQLDSLFAMLKDRLSADTASIPGGCEASPSTVNPEKLALLRSHGVDRLSLGVQSFDDNEVHAIGRPQRSSDVHQAIEWIREAGFPTMNLDLIYGGHQQSVDGWLSSVRQAAEYRAEEIYLYPLYVRRLTGLGKISERVDLSQQEQQRWDAERLTAYRAARDLLRSAGYRQVSMRMFQRPSDRQPAAPTYRCQEDGMIGLGCGARSYTRRLHYSYEYAIRSTAVRSILDQYIGRSRESFAHVDFGFRLGDEDQRRRYLIISLLQCEGLSRADYRLRFGGDVLDEFPMLHRLESAGHVELRADRLQLTDSGIEHSDAIGPWLNSSKVKQLEASYQWR